MTKKAKFEIVLVLLISMNLACKKEKSNPPPNSTTPIVNKSATFRIFGNYTGRLVVISTNKNGSNNTDTVKTLPWSRYVEYDANVGGIGISGNTIIGYFGLPAQTVTVQIESNGSIVKSGNASVGTNSIVNPLPLTYLFIN